MDILKRMHAARSAAVTCSASRHAAQIGAALVLHDGDWRLANAPRECGESIADTARLDWLADPNNQIGNVQIPIDCVLAHPESMRAAIDMAMRMGTDAT